MPELRVLNQNTFFATAEISEEFTTPSAIFFVYGDGKNIVLFCFVFIFKLISIYYNLLLFS